MQVRMPAAAILLLISLVSCASTGDDKGSSIPDMNKIMIGEPVVPREANTVFLELMTSGRDISGVSDIFTVMLKRRLSMDGRLAVTAERDRADLVLQYGLGRYQVQVLKYGDFGRPVRKRMRIVAAMLLRDRVRDRVILTDREIQSFREFSDVLPPVETEVQVLNEILDNLASRVFSKTVSGWYTEYMTRIEKGKK